MLPVCLLSAVSRTRVINGKIIEDEASNNFRRFLAEDFFLPVIKPLGTYFNNKLLPSCRSSFAATSVLLCAPLDPIRLDRNSKSDGKVFQFFLDKHCIESCEARFLQQQLE